MRPRLNGWQRLWVVASVLYLIAVTAIAAARWPTAETTGHRDEFITQMPAKLRTEVVAAYNSEHEWNKHVSSSKDSFKVDSPPAFVPGSSRIIERDRVISLPPEFVLVSGPVQFPNNAVLEIAVARKGDIEPNVAAARAYWAVVEEESRAKQWKSLWVAGLIWLVPSGAFYAFGSAIAWIRRGFRTQIRS